MNTLSLLSSGLGIVVFSVPLLGSPVCCTFADLTLSLPFSGPQEGVSFLGHLHLLAAENACQQTAQRDVFVEEFHVCIPREPLSPPALYIPSITISSSKSKHSQANSYLEYDFRG